MINGMPSTAEIYAIRSGQAIGSLRVINGYLKAATDFPDMRDYYLGKAFAYTGSALAEIDIDPGVNGNGQTTETAGTAA